MGWIILGILVFFAALYLFLVMPSRPTDDKAGPFLRRSFAHRGFYDNDEGVPENSLAAFKRAAEHGYGCELDVQLTKDKKLIVFHDNDFSRSSGVDKPVWELTYDEVRELSLFGSSERAPLFTEVLECVSGQIPLIVEIKAEGINTSWYAEVCEQTKRELEGYSGDYCIESFHPYVVNWVKNNMKGVLRGQLVTGIGDYHNLKRVVAFCITNLLTSFYTRPNFIAYNERAMGASLKISKALGAMSVVWTVNNQARHDELSKTEDSMIFEHYYPDPFLK